jgi:hypothetical protein
MRWYSFEQCNCASDCERQIEMLTLDKSTSAWPTGRVYVDVPEAQRIVDAMNASIAARQSR